MKKKGQAEDKLGLVLHIIGAALSVPILVLCTVRGAIEYGAAGVLTGLAFSVSMLILSLFSAIYHGRCIKGKDDKFFRVMDYCSIFFLSAGAYTPIALIALMKVEPAVAWTLFGAVWALAAWGIVMNLIGPDRFKDLSMARRPIRQPGWFLGSIAVQNMRIRSSIFSCSWATSAMGS